MGRRGHHIKLAKSSHLRLIYTVIGWLFVSLGIIGIFLPIVPTTPFLLLAAACFARGSESAYNRLVANPYCGPYIAQWRATGTVPLRAKVVAITLIAASMSVSIVFFVPVLAGQIAMGVVGLAVVGYLLTLPTEPRK